MSAPQIRPRSSKIFGFVAGHVRGVGQGGAFPAAKRLNYAFRIMHYELKKYSLFPSKKTSFSLILPCRKSLKRYNINAYFVIRN